ncbi:MAG: hypothetical protein ACRDNK_07590 [Solirubrobacteraceae bacterium]
MLVLALSMLLVAGCGSSSKTSSVAAKASSSTTSTAPASSSSSASPASTSTTSSTATGKRAKRGTASTATTGNGSASGRTPVPNPLRQILRARPHDSFETKLNNLCSRGNRATLPFARRYRQAFLGHNYVLLASLREQALKAYEAVAHPTSLTPPASHQGAFQRYLAASQSFAKVNHQIDAALAAHNLSGVQKLQQTIVAVGTARAQAAIALGARSCAI